MFRSTGGFDKTLEKATSNLLMEPDWPSILQICDMVRQKDVAPKYALSALSKKLNSGNPHTAYYALLVLESLVKNCGASLHEELTTPQYCQVLHELAKTTQHDSVKQKLLELIQAWTFAFRKNPRYSALKDTMTVMKTEGYKFPALRESDAMFSADTAPEWADGDSCHRCRVTFSIVQRKHHCRACGQVFCSQCSQKTTTLPKFGIEKEVRVCDACYEQFTKPSHTSKSTSEKQESELPLEYLNSSLAQQNQAPPRKSEEELREEEELQLALALSQSEAEAKEKQKIKTTTFTPPQTVKSEPKLTDRSDSPDDSVNPELARYLNRTYWESRQSDVVADNRPTSPSAPATAPVQNNEPKFRENGIIDTEMDEFVTTLKSQVEIFINRMKSNSSRGRSIANDSSVQTLFMNITAMHSRLLRYIQQHDDSRLHYERLQDKLTQVKDARAALDALREEHREKLRRQAEEAERQRQLQMAHKLEIMRKKKQEYLQYQRQLALQRIQEQEREMQMRQEQQKQQYLMGPAYGSYINSPVHAQQFPPNSAPPMGAYHGFPYGQQMMGGPGPQPHVMPPQSAPSQIGHSSTMNPMHMQHPQGFPPGHPQSQTGHNFVPNSQQMVNQMPMGMQQNPGLQGLPPPQQMVQPQGMPQTHPPGIPQPNIAGMPQQNNPPLPQPNQNAPPQQFQQQPPPSSQQNDTQTAELISFD